MADSFFPAAFIGIHIRCAARKSGNSFLPGWHLKKMYAKVLDFNFVGIVASARESSFVRILIVDDHEIVRAGVCSILSSRKDIEVCGEAGNGKEAVEKAIELKPDLIILDITMPVLSGFDASIRIRKVLPNVPILILSMHDSQTVRQACRRAGAQGYVSKMKAAEILLRAVDLLVRGGTFFPATKTV